MSFSPEQDKENERAKTIEWACKCLLNENLVQKRTTNFSILKSCVESIDGSYNISSVCDTLRSLLDNVSENDEIYEQAHALLISIVTPAPINSYNSKTMKTTTASILFLDLQGFSSLEESEVICFFEDVLKDLADNIINKYRDRIDDINTWGDGLIVIMTDPYEIARLALDIRDFYRNYNWSQNRMPKLLARIALHHGRVYRCIDHLRQIESVMGTEVTLGARLEPIVEPNEIWCTHDFRVLVKQDKDKTIDFDHLGDKEFAKNFGNLGTYKLRRSHED